MNVEVLYSYVIGSTWCFLVSWVVLLLAAYVVAFHQDWSWRRARLDGAEMGAASQRYTIHPMPDGH